jgi:hypothetical protein
MVHRIGRAAIPDDETLILPACRGDSCNQGRQQCRTPETCYAEFRRTADQQREDCNDLAHAVALWVASVVIVVVSTAIVCGVL